MAKESENYDVLIRFEKNKNGDEIIVIENGESMDESIDLVPCAGDDCDIVIYLTD